MSGCMACRSRIACSRASRNADEALGMLSTHSGTIDVILTDVVMPGTPPAILVEQIRARHPQVRVIYMSGYAAPGDAAQIDARDFLAKPFSMDSLLRKLGGART